MDRRSVLYASTGMVSSVLAGCVGLPDPRADQPDEADDNGPREHPFSADVDDDAIAHVLDAVDLLEEAFEELTRPDDWADVDRDRVTSLVDAANEHLEAAAEYDEPDLVRAIRNLGLFGGLLVQLAVVFDQLDVVVDGYDTAVALVSAGQFDDAARLLEDFRGVIERIEGSIDSITGMLDRMDGDTVDAFDRLSWTAYRDQVDAAKAYLEGLVVLFDGMGPFIDGLRFWEDALGYYDGDEFARSGIRFEDAARAFDDAAGLVAAAVPALTGDIRGTAARLGCLAEAYAAASDHYASAMFAMDDGDAEQANAALEQAAQARDVEC